MRKHYWVKQPPIQKVEHPPILPPVLAMADDISDFMLDREAQQVAASTLDWHKRALGKFRAYCLEAGIKATAAVDARVLRAYLKHLEEVGHNPGGISNLYRSTRAFLHWYADEYELANLHNTLRKVHPPTVSDDPLDPISLKDFAALVAQCVPRTFPGERDRAMLYVLLDTGIRHQELTNLTVADINTEQGSILIRKGKGGKGRTVFVGAKGRRALTSYLRWREQPSSWSSSNQVPPLAGAKALWITDEGEPLTKSGIRQVISRLARYAKIKEPGLHMFRRAFCVNSLRNGMDVITLQRLMGHSSLAIINRYLKLVYEDLRTAQGKYSVVDNL